MKDKRRFVIGVITALLAAVCFGINFFTGLQWRFLISGILLLAFSGMNFSNAFSRRGVLEELAAEADERDRYVTMKSSHFTLKIVNYILCTVCFISTILYGAFQLQAYLVISITLCTTLVTLFVTMLLANSYYEKHE